MYTLATQKLDQVSDDVLQRTTVSKRAANVVMREIHKAPTCASGKLRCFTVHLSIGIQTQMHRYCG